MKEIITVQQRSGVRYAGIGARKTPRSILKLFPSIGAMCAAKGHVLQTGGCNGPDKEIETGHAFLAPSNVEVFIPWEGYNKRSGRELSVQTGTCLESILIAKKYYIHPNRDKTWDNLKYSHKQLMARNGYQVLGKDLNTPVDFVICYTPKGEIIGGTGQALRIAKDYGIKVINLGNPNHLTWIIDLLKKEEKYNFKLIKETKI